MQSAHLAFVCLAPHRRLGVRHRFLTGRRIAGISVVIAVSVLVLCHVVTPLRPVSPRDTSPVRARMGTGAESEAYDEPWGDA